VRSACVSLEKCIFFMLATAPPDGCRGFWHVLGRVRALVFFPGHGCDDALHLEFGSGFSRHDETSGNRQNLPSNTPVFSGRNGILRGEKVQIFSIISMKFQ
jgi:hypothetical protein